MAAIDETVPDPPASQVRHRLRHRAGSFPFAGGPRLTVRSVTPISAAMAKPRGQSLAPFTDFTASRNASRRCSAMLCRAIRRDHGHVVADAAATSVGMV
jgi:hypothetical protein